MNRLFKAIFWTFLFLVMILAIDQLLVQVPPMHPAHAAVSNFYRDFRSRMIDLAFGEKQAEPQSIEAVIETMQKKPQEKPSKEGPASKEKRKPEASSASKAAQRYIYSDGKGELQFADSLEDVPKEYRAQAQPMGD